MLRVSLGQSDITFSENGANESLDHRAQALVELWQETAQGSPLPARSDFLPESHLRPWLGDIAITTVEPDPLRFKVRLAGMNIVHADGEDLTGQYLDEVFPDRYQTEIHVPFADAVDSRQAVSCRIYFGKDMMYLADQLILPLAGNGETVDHLLIFISTVPKVRASDDMDALNEVVTGTARPRRLKRFTRPHA